MGRLRQFVQRLSKPSDSVKAPALDTDAEPAADVEYSDTPPALPPPPTEQKLQEPAPQTPGARPEPHETVPPVTIGYATHVGCVREINQDSLLVSCSVADGDSPLAPFCLLLVADGMGGHSDGQKASQLASRIVARDVMRQVYPPFLQVSDNDQPRPVQEILSSALQAANWQVNESNPESGTTVTAALVLGSRLFLAHVGDSRAYWVREDTQALDLLTLDHSFVQRLQDAGQITAEEAAVHPQRNVLYRAIGQGERLEVDTSSRPLPHQSWLLLCSDGLWGVVSEEVIYETIVSSATPQLACDLLTQAALDAGAPDNISVVIARIE